MLESDVVCDAVHVDTERCVDLVALELVYKSDTFVCPSGNIILTFGMTPTRDDVADCFFVGFLDFCLGSDSALLDWVRELIITVTLGISAVGAQTLLLAVVEVAVTFTELKGMLDFRRSRILWNGLTEDLIAVVVVVTVADEL